jgi:flagellar biosynthetic protein FliR
VTFSVQPATIVAFLLVMTRLVAAFTIAPPFGGQAVPVRVRAALGASIALVVAPLQSAEVQGAEVPIEAGPLIVALGYQVVVGALFGFLVQLLLSAPLVGGTLIDYLTGFSAAALFDPFSQASATPAARLNQAVALVVLVILDGHLLIVRGVLRSYEAAPLGGMQVESLASVLSEGASQLFLAAIEIAFPVLVALMLAEVVLGLAARAAPRLNVLIVGFAIKSMIFLVTFAVTVPLTINAVAALLDRSVRWAVTGLGG